MWDLCDAAFRGRPPRYRTAVLTAEAGGRARQFWRGVNDTNYATLRFVTVTVIVIDR